MNCSPNPEKQQELLAHIVTFVGQSSGLSTQSSSSISQEITQKVDGKSITVKAEDLDDVLFRTDTEGQDFIQINFCSGLKILVTDTLIGFKPAALQGLDLNKLPKVVTTPDILSVFEAIQETMYFSDRNLNEEIQVLKRVFDAVITGGEAIGFNLSVERSWMGRIPSQVYKASA